VAYSLQAGSVVRYREGMSSSDTLEFNPFLPEVHEDPYPLYHRLRAEDPVHRSPLGFWVLTRHADVIAVLRDPRMSRDPLRSERVALLRASAEVDELLASEEAAPSMLFVDPPDHTRLRTLVNKAFTPAAVERLRPRVEEIVAGLLDRAAGAGAMDVVEELAYPLPVTVICELFGVPEADRDRFRAWSRGLAAACARRRLRRIHRRQRPGGFRQQEFAAHQPPAAAVRAVRLGRGSHLVATGPSRP